MSDEDRLARRGRPGPTAEEADMAWWRTMFAYTAGRYLPDAALRDLTADFERTVKNLRKLAERRQGP